MPPTKKQEIPKNKKSSSSSPAFPLSRYKNPKVLWLLQLIESDDKNIFNKLGMIQETFFFHAA